MNKDLLFVNKKKQKNFFLSALQHPACGDAGVSKNSMLQGG